MMFSFLAFFLFKQSTLSLLKGPIFYIEFGSDLRLFTYFFFALISFNLDLFFMEALNHFAFLLTYNTTKILD